MQRMRGWIRPISILRALKVHLIIEPRPVITLKMIAKVQIIITKGFLRLSSWTPQAARATYHNKNFSPMSTVFVYFQGAPLPRPFQNAKRASSYFCTILLFTRTLFFFINKLFGEIDPQNISPLLLFLSLFLSLFFGLLNFFQFFPFPYNNVKLSKILWGGGKVIEV